MNISRKTFVHHHFNADQSVPFTLIYFFSEQVQKIKEGGLRALISKISKAPFYFIAIPLVILIRLISPLFLVKMGELRSERIGHLALSTIIYFRQKQKNKKAGIDIFYCRSEISNFQLVKMWKRNIFCASFVKYLHLVNKLIPGGEKFDLVTPPPREYFGLLPLEKPILSFTPEEENLGKEQLLKIGINPGSSFVCFYARDVAYLRAVAPKMNWGYHDHRNTNINEMLPAMAYVAAKGYFSLRVGAVVDKKIKTEHLHQKIIDYAMDYRSDFMDIYLGAKCRFFVGPPAGLIHVPQIFGRPIVWTDFIPLGEVHSGYRPSLCIFKKLWLKEEKRLMTFPEILRTGAGRYYNTRDYQKHDIEVINNSPEEILAVVNEMEERINGNWKTTEEDEELQKRFWSLFKPNELNQVFLARVGTDFLRQNQELLNP